MFGILMKDMIMRNLFVVLVLILFAAAAFLAWTPWRTHGGRFVTEYLLMGGAVAFVGVVIALVLLFTR
jgi:hypothetical protein